jgi:aldehyde dehydrogenase (NAD+)
MLGPSLLEGNTAVFKPSEDTPAVGQRLVELFQEAGFPPGVLNLVHGDGMVGEALVRNPDVNVVLFTGSYEVGHRIQQLSAEFFDRIVACEMGSKSAVIVCADARLDLAVNCALISAFKTSGQRCVSAGRVLVAEPILDKFNEKLVARALRLRIGEPLDAGNFTGPVIHRGAVEKVESYNALAKKEGAKVLLDGGRLTQGEHGAGCYLSPFIYQMAHRPDARCLREEVFGPHLAVIPFKTNEDAVRIYNATDYGLSMAVVTEDYRAMRLFRDECEFGMGYVNLPCIGAEVHLPFGGVKKSGNGHPSAAGLVETVTHKIAWTVNHGTEVKMAQGLTTEIEGGPA